MNNRLIAAVIIVATSLIQVGCASQARTDTTFGDAVREVTMNQTYDLGASAFSNSDAVVGGDPYQLENTIKVHREGSSQPVDVRSEIRVGTGSSNR